MANKISQVIMANKNKISLCNQKNKKILYVYRFGLLILLNGHKHMGRLLKHG